MLHYATSNKLLPNRFREIDAKPRSQAELMHGRVCMLAVFKALRMEGMEAVQWRTLYSGFRVDLYMGFI